MFSIERFPNYDTMYFVLFFDACDIKVSKLRECYMEISDTMGNYVFLSDFLELLICIK
jgi:hypothetical protein